MASPGLEGIANVALPDGSKSSSTNDGLEASAHRGKGQDKLNHGWRKIVRNFTPS